MDQDQLKKVMEQAKKTLPGSDIEFNAMTTNPVWGQSTADTPIELRTRLTELSRSINQDGEDSIEEVELWDLLSFYTRDLRLGNLQQNAYTDEVKACRHYLDLAGDLLHFGYKRAFLICLSRVASILELSQSRGGFFRRRMGTITGENLSGSLDPPKRNFMGAVKKPDQYQG